MTMITEAPTKTAIGARILADSISPVGVRLVTIEATYPRCIHAEVMTHRVFSRNAASSRAIPLAVTLRKVTLDPFVPQHWGRNQKGMQAGEELPEPVAQEAREAILKLRDHAAATVWLLDSLGLHKQIGNRYLEPWMWYTCILTGTEWLNFLHLRKHPAAEPHLADLAASVYEAIRDSHPKHLKDGDWHLPLIQEDELGTTYDEELARVSTARCARVSYLTHDGRRDMAADLGLFEKLLGGGHMSPLEHAAQATTDVDVFYGNLRGWMSLRYLMPGEWDILGYRGEAEELLGLDGLH